MFDFVFLFFRLFNPSINFRSPPPPPTPLHTYKLTVNEATLCTNPFVFTPPFPPNNVLKPNPKPSSTNLGHLLASHSAAKRPPTQAMSNKQSHLKTELHMQSITEHKLMNASTETHTSEHTHAFSLSLFFSGPLLFPSFHLCVRPSLASGWRLWLRRHGRCLSPSASTVISPSHALSEGPPPSWTPPPSHPSPF